MQVVHERGLDVHKRSVVACVLITRPDGMVEQQVHMFKTMTTDLLALADWLECLEVIHVAMESTGVYWRPVYDRAQPDVAAADGTPHPLPGTLHGRSGTVRPTKQGGPRSETDSCRGRPLPGSRPRRRL